MQGITWPAEDLLGSQEGRCSVDLVVKEGAGWSIESRMTED
jgi:hypothetical protein